MWTKLAMRIWLLVSYPLKTIRRFAVTWRSILAKLLQRKLIISISSSYSYRSVSPCRSRSEFFFSFCFCVCGNGSSGTRRMGTCMNKNYNIRVSIHWFYWFLHSLLRFVYSFYFGVLYQVFFHLIGNFPIILAPVRIHLLKWPITITVHHLCLRKKTQIMILRRT